MSDFQKIIPMEYTNLESISSDDKSDDKIIDTPGCSSQINKPKKESNKTKTNKNTKVERKRKPVDSNGENVLKKKPNLDKAKLSGIEKFLHGILYQNKLIQYIIQKGLQNDCNFEVGSEIKEAEKFDDVVFKYRNDTDKWTCIFIQAKHKDTPSKKEEQIGYKDLKKVSDRNPFSLLKYFISFCKIIRNTNFAGFEIKDFIICTNNTFNFKKTTKINEQEVETKWKNFFEFSDVKSDDNLFYISDFKVEVARFKRDESIRDELVKVMFDIFKDAESKNNKKKEEICKLLDNEDSTKNDLYIFFERFKIIYNFPEDDNWNKIFNWGEKLNLIDPFLADYAFTYETLMWMAKAKRNKRFYTNETFKEFLKKLGKRLDTLRVFGIDYNHIEKIRGYNIGYQENINSLYKFLGAENFQVYHLISKKTMLGVMMILANFKSEMFRENFTYLNKIDGFIFLRLKSLKNPDIQKMAMSAFSSDTSYVLLVIEFDVNYPADNMLLELLKDKLNNLRKKKVIIITSEDEKKINATFDGIICKESSIQYSFKKLTENSKKNILETIVRFQGKQVNLNKIIGIPLANDIIDETILFSLIKKNDIEIGSTSAFSSEGYVPEYYTERVLYRRPVKNSIFNSCDANIRLFITNDKNQEIKKLCKNKALIENKFILPSSEKDNYEEFQQICETYSQSTIFWLKFIDKKLYCINVHAKDKFLTWENYFSSHSFYKNNCCGEKELIDTTNGEKVVIIANDPGMGKSTFLSSIAKKMVNSSNMSELWVRRINLNECTQLLTKIDFNEKNQVLVNIILDMIYLTEGNRETTYKNTSTNELDDTIFRAILTSSNIRSKISKVVILFDGFDEISPIYREKTITLIKLLKRINLLQIWITTRSQEVYFLQQELDSVAYFLRSLIGKEQISFLNRFWKWKIKNEINDNFNQGLELLDNICYSKYIERYKCGKDIKKALNTYREGKNEEQVLLKEINALTFSTYAKVLIQSWMKTFKPKAKKEAKDFLATPLHLKMLGDIVFHEMFKIPQNISLANLYKELVERKFDFYFKQKSQMNKTNLAMLDNIKDLKKIYKTNHINLSIRLLLPNEYHHLFPKIQKNMDFSEKHKLLNIGLLILKGNNLSFIHRSYGEYFLSEGIIDCLKDGLNVGQVLLDLILSEKEYILTRCFLNALLEEHLNKNKVDLCLDKIENNFYTSLLNSSGKETNSLMYGIKLYQALYIAVYNNHNHIVTILLSYMKDTYSKYSQFDKVIVIFKLNNILHIACQRGNIATIEWFLGFVKKHYPKDLKGLVLAKTSQKNKFNALHLSILNAHTNAVIKLLELINDKKIIKKLIFQLNGSGKRVVEIALNKAQRKTLLKLLEYLKENHRDIFDTLFLDEKIFLKATSSNNSEIVTFILNSFDVAQLKDLLLVALPKLFISDKISIVTTILKWLKSKNHLEEIIYPYSNATIDFSKRVCKPSIWDVAYQNDKQIKRRIENALGKRNDMTSSNHKLYMQSVIEIKNQIDSFREAFREALRQNNLNEVKMLLNKYTRNVNRELILDIKIDGKRYIDFVSENNFNDIKTVLQENDLV